MASVGAGGRRWRRQTPAPFQDDLVLRRTGTPNGAGGARTGPLVDGDLRVDTGARRATLAGTLESEPHRVSWRLH